MGMVKQSGAVLAAVVIAVALPLLTGPALAQERQLSEDAVRKYMDHAWDMLPDRFTHLDGRAVNIDKKDKSKVLVSIDTGRDVIMAARTSAYAQACELGDEQVDNHRSLMRRETVKKKWTEQQMVFINQLHLTTTMLLLGTIKLVEQADGGKEIVELEAPPKIKKPSDEDCKGVKERILAYVKAGPPAPVAPPPTAPLAAAPKANPLAPTVTGTNPPKAAAPAPKTP
jgi:hypothetical protein